MPPPRRLRRRPLRLSLSQRHRPHLHPPHSPAGVFPACGTRARAVPNLSAGCRYSPRGIPAPLARRPLRPPQPANPTP
eukprot:SM010957S18846  [mRNA]  locus=s10957:102:360:+ [translate_table: standard]